MIFKVKSIRKIKFLLIFFCLTGSAYAYDNGDFQVWHTDSGEKKINDKFKLYMEQEFRWGDNASELYYQHYEPGLIYEVNKHLDVGIKYRQIYDKKGGKFKEENQPNLHMALNWDFLECSFSDRSRLEYRHFDYQADSWLYRNKLTVKLPLKFTRFSIRPYLSEEIFIQFLNTAFAQNRFGAGLELTLTKNIKTEIYYMLQSKKESHNWINANVLGTSLKIAF